MMWFGGVRYGRGVRALLAIVLLLVTSARDANAHGTLAPKTITFRQGHDRDIAVIISYGLVTSHDGGATWQWMCEKAAGYSNAGYVPHLAYTDSGALFSTAFAGLLVDRPAQVPADDRVGCTFGPTPAGKAFASLDAVGPDHALYYAASDASLPDTHIYKSTDDGATFEQLTTPEATADDWWQTLVIAPGDPERMYLSGFRLVNICDGTGQCVLKKRWLLFASRDGGHTFSALPGHLLLSGDNSSGLKSGDDSAIDFVGVDPVDPDMLYAQVTTENGTTIGDGIYRLDVAVDTAWTRIFGKADSIAFVTRASGQLVAGTTTLGTFTSNDRGGTWTQLANAPSIGCLSEDAEGNMWACSLNDPVAVRKSSDLATWTPAMRYSELIPLSCPAGTVQHDTCVGDPAADGEWCGLLPTFGIQSTPVDCPVNGPPPPPPPPPSHAGCCDTGAGGAGAFVIASFVAVALLTRPRRSRPRGHPAG
jgi:hypothetical protein